MEGFAPSAQFNITAFGKYITCTFNEVFVTELCKVLNLDEQISEDFSDFTNSVTLCKSNNNSVAATKDKQDEFAVFKYNGIYTVLLENVFARDLANATVDSVRLYSEGTNVLITPLFAFSKRLESVVENRERHVSNRSYAGRSSEGFGDRGFRKNFHGR